MMQLKKRPDLSGVATMDRPATPMPLPAKVEPPKPARLSASNSLPLVLIQLLLLIALVYKYSIENTAFLHVLVIASGGFLVQLLLPQRRRLQWFLAVSLVCLVVVFGQVGAGWSPLTGLARTACLVAMGSVLIAACHLPISFWPRAAVLTALGALAAVFRSQWIQAPALDAIWPILGSMFMFRLIVYLYDISNEPKRSTLTQSLAYFFLLPNVCFPLFPVIDFKTFIRGHFDGDPARIYQKGITWMLRGILQLMLYRLVYYDIAIDPAKMANGTDLFRHLLATMFIYVRVSGQFHLAIGLLHLYGFNLPETNRNYFLASSFTDYWRRVNVYWKDFILKIFYYPAYFRLKKLGPTRAMVLATIFSFVATWLLHSYQWYWLRRQFPITPQDIIFWGVLCTLVIINVWWEMHHRTPQKLLKPKRPTPKAQLGLALRTAGTFCLLTALWSIWTADSLREWASIWKMTDAHTFLYGGLLLIGIMIASLTIDRDASTWSQLVQPRVTPRFPRRFAWAGIITSFVLLLLIGNRWMPPLLHGWPGQLLESMAMTKPNARDSAKMQRAYYENLMDVGSFNSELWTIYNQKPSNWKGLDDTNISRRTGDFLEFELVPNTNELVNGVMFSTNRWGMHDRDYTLAKSPNVHRTALLGASHLLGYHIDAAQDFENLTEDRLNAHLAPNAPKQELLNFAVYYYSSLRQLILLDTNRIWQFHPDVVMVFVHENEKRWTVDHLTNAILAGVPMPYPYLKEIVDRAKVTRDMPRDEISRKLTPLSGQVVQWSYQQIVDRCRRANVKPVWVFLPLLPDDPILTSDPEAAHAEPVYERWAADAGFTTINLESAYKGHPRREVAVASWDNHPNLIGHRLLADAFYRALLAHPELGYAPPASLQDTPLRN